MKNLKTDVAYDAIRRRILSGEFGPGDWLVADELSQLTGVGRTPVRDALFRLEADGLVRMKGQFGAHVCCLDFTELKELGEVRLALAVRAATLAARNASPVELAEVVGARDALAGFFHARLLADRPEPPRAEEAAEFRLRLSIVVAARNRMLHAMFLRAHWISWVTLGPARNALAAMTAALPILSAYDDVVTALVRRDASAAASMMESCMRAALAQEQELAFHFRNSGQPAEPYAAAF